MLELLYSALRSVHGIVFRHDGEFESVRQKLYATKRDAIDPELSCLGFAKSPTSDQEIWIVKK